MRRELGYGAERDGCAESLSFGRELRRVPHFDPVKRGLGAFAQEGTDATGGLGAGAGLGGDGGETLHPSASSFSLDQLGKKGKIRKKRKRRY